MYILLRYNVANLIIKLLMLTTPMKQYIANELPKETGMDLLICASLIISLICKFTRLTIEFISIYKFLVIFVTKFFFLSLLYVKGLTSLHTLSASPCSFQALFITLPIGSLARTHDPLVHRKCSSHADHFSCSKLKWG